MELMGRAEKSMYICAVGLDADMKHLLGIG